MPEAAQTFAHQWLESYGDKLYSYALARVGWNAGLAEDLVQETLLAGLHGYERFSHKSSVETWLFGILRRKVVDHYRRSGRKTAEVSLEDFFSSSGSVKHLGAWRFNADQLLESREFLETLDSCMSKLNPKLRESFALSVVDELPAEEVCKILEISPTNLSVRLHRARLALRRCLEINWFEGE